MTWIVYFKGLSASDCLTLTSSEMSLTKAVISFAPPLWWHLCGSPLSSPFNISNSQKRMFFTEADEGTYNEQEWQIKETPLLASQWWVDPRVSYFSGCPLHLSVKLLPVRPMAMVLLRIRTYPSLIRDSLPRKPQHPEFWSVFGRTKRLSLIFHTTDNSGKYFLRCVADNEKTLVLQCVFQSWSF